MSQNPHMRFDDQAFNDENSNDSDNRSFEQILRERVSRRDVLKTGAALGTVTAGAMMLGYSPQVHAKNDNPTQAAKQLNFKAVDKNTLDTVSVPAGYTASIIYALGDPLKADVPAYRNDGSDTQFEHRAGDHHDRLDCDRGRVVFDRPHERRARIRSRRRRLRNLARLARHRCRAVVAARHVSGC